MVDVAGTVLTPEDVEVLRHPLVGSVILFTRNYQNPQQVAALTAAIRALRTPQLLIAVDHEGGRVQRFRPGFSALPPLRLSAPASGMLMFNTSKLTAKPEDAVALTVNGAVP